MNVFGLICFGILTICFMSMSRMHTEKCKECDKLAQEVKMLRDQLGYMD